MGPLNVRFCALVWLRRLVVAVLATCCASPAWGEADRSGLGWRMTALDLTVWIDAEQRTVELQGRARLRLEGRERSAGPWLWLNAREPAMEWTGASCEGAADIELNGVLGPSNPAARVARVLLEQPAVRGDEIEVAYSCRSIGQSFQLRISGACALASWVSAWHPIPVLERAASAADTAAPGETRIHLPDGWVSLSAGELVERSPGLDVWRVGPSVARSFMAGAYTVAEREVVGGRRVSVYALEAPASSVEAQLGSLSDALAALEGVFGPSPYASYGVGEFPAEIASFSAGSEQGFLMVNSEILAAERGNLPLFAHEMAHAWWGNLVGARGPGAIVCTESLSQYGAVLTIEAVEGVGAAREFLIDSREGSSPMQCARGYFEAVELGWDRPLAALGGGPHDHLLSDSKGHWVLHMARWRLGDERFLGALRSLIAAHAGGSMTLDDVRGALIDAAGEDAAPMRAFLAEWLDRPGAMVVDAVFTSFPAGDGWRTRVRLTQPGIRYTTPVEVRFAWDGGSAVRTVELSGGSTTADFVLPAKPTRLEVDPEDRLLLWRPAYGPRPAFGRREWAPPAD